MARDKDDKPAGKLSKGLADAGTSLNGLTLDTSIELLIPDRIRHASYFKQMSGAGAPANHLLTQNQIIFGRGNSADVSIDSRELSRRHIRVNRDGHEFIVTDLDSRNGLFLNGVRIHACVLRHGDTIQIGNVRFVYYEGH